MNRHERRKHLKVLERGFASTVASRPCGACMACCTALAVAELDKPVGVRCTEAGGEGEPGCRIYAQRPRACRDYLCGWKMGFGEREQRPDQLGLLLSPMPGTSPAHPGFIAHEVIEDAWYSLGAQALLRDMAQSFVIVLVRGGLPSKMLVPEPRAASLRSFIDGLRDETAREATVERVRPARP